VSTVSPKSPIHRPDDQRPDNGIPPLENGDRLSRAEEAPELVAEVASSSVSYDLNTKLIVYRRNGVREYIVRRVLDREIDWFSLRGRRYVRLPLDKTGVYRSEVFPGLWVDAAALVRGDMTSARATLQRGLFSMEHTEFVARYSLPAKP
jgi:Uma2 family endonuclease